MKIRMIAAAILLSSIVHAGGQANKTDESGANQPQILVIPDLPDRRITPPTGLELQQIQATLNESAAYLFKPCSEVQRETLDTYFEVLTDAFNQLHDFERHYLNNPANIQAVLTVKQAVVRKTNECF